jgi:ribosomal protein S24E
MNFEKMKEMIELQLQANVEHMNNGEPSTETLAKIEVVAQELNIAEHLIIVQTLEEIFGNVELSMVD